MASTLRWLPCALLCVFGRLAAGKVRYAYVVITSPSTHNVLSIATPSVHSMSLTAATREDPPAATVLIDGAASACTGESCNQDSDRGLKSPRGLALCQGVDDSTLFVSDDDADNIYAYELAGGGEDLLSKVTALTVGRQRLIRESVGGKVSGMSCDGRGNLYFTVDSGKIQMLKAVDLATGTKLTPVDLYSSDSFDTVSGPSGIAADGFHVFWANEAGGGSSGSVTSAPVTPGTPASIAGNGAGALGVCLARRNVYYTAESRSLFAVKQSGGSIAEVSQNFKKPRGCAYDGESSLYVADEEANAVYSIPAVASLRAVRHLHKVATVEAPSQVAVYTPGGGALHGAALGESGSMRESPRVAMWFVTVAALVVATISS